MAGAASGETPLTEDRPDNALIMNKNTEQANEGNDE
jgi:hypothetical protein